MFSKSKHHQPTINQAVGRHVSLIQPFNRRTGFTPLEAKRLEAAKAVPVAGRPQTGFTIIELLVSIAIFSLLALGVISSFAALARTVKLARENTTLAALASDYMEITRNMPYGQVGTMNGNPSGPLPDLPNATTTVISGIKYKIYYVVTNIHDPSDPGVGNASYKQVKVNIINTSTGHLASFLTTVSPQGLAGISSTTGAILINVYDSDGQPVSNASVSIQNLILSPNIILNRQSNASGTWAEVGLPPSVNGYHIVVTKNGYSTDQTYPLTGLNPNPLKPDATVVSAQATQVSFFIDLLSNLAIKTLNQYCQNVNSVNVNVLGAKLIGTNPTVYKFNQNYTSSAGLINLSNIEWDTYTPTLLSGQSWIVQGTSPIQKIDVLPGTSQIFNMILTTNSTANSLLVIVKDASTNAAIENASVTLTLSSTSYSAYTGGSVWVQNSWTGGPGQAQWNTTTPTRYFQDSGTVDYKTAPTGLRLSKVGNNYQANGWVESSTFDTGSANSNYTILTFQPTSQSSGTSIKFQIAANNDNATWNYIGPDGTSGSYYTTSGTSISNNNDNNRYVRYKVFLNTTKSNVTPVLTSVNLNYVSGCFTPGQSYFGDLAANGSYSLTVSANGYQTQTINSLNINGNQALQVLMTP